MEGLLLCCFRGEINTLLGLPMNVRVTLARVHIASNLGLSLNWRSELLVVTVEVLICVDMQQPDRLPTLPRSAAIYLYLPVVARITPAVVTKVSADLLLS